ncbi:MAG TPA: L-lysine 6-transaminase [Chloroflexia bacterium]|nr:L-lysine 6-transaminase [Chloroflexia bacterium]
MTTVSLYGTDRNSINPADVHQTLSRKLLVDGYPFVYDHRASQGSWLVDAVNGRRYLDFFSFFASAPVGHNHPGLKDPDFRERIADIASINPSNSEVYTIEMAEFVHALTAKAAPEDMHHFFFVAGGAPAVENALKVAFDWKVRKNFAKGYNIERGHKIIHFKEAFHGRLGYTLSLTNTADPRKYMYFPRFQDWPRIENPKLRHPLTPENLQSVQEAERRAVAQIEEAFRQHLDDIAAIIIEPIQAEGGDNHFRPEFFAELRRLADENEALLIFDEIQTGVGITGKFWATEYTGVRPDIIVFGKKLQVCGVMAGERVDEVERNVFVEPSRINSTWGGNLVDMVRATRFLEIIEEEKLVENAYCQGQKLMEGLAQVQERCGRIDNLRGKGLMIAFDLPTHAERDEVIQKAFEREMLLLPCGTRSIRLRPHLDVKPEVVEEALNRLEDTLCA